MLDLKQIEAIYEDTGRVECIWWNYRYLTFWSRWLIIRPLWSDCETRKKLNIIFKFHCKISLYYMVAKFNFVNLIFRKLAEYFLLKNRYDHAWASYKVYKTDHSHSHFHSHFPTQNNSFSTTTGWTTSNIKININ